MKQGWRGSRNWLLKSRHWFICQRGGCPGSLKHLTQHVLKHCNVTSVQFGKLPFSFIVLFMLQMWFLHFCIYWISCKWWYQGYVFWLVNQNNLVKHWEVTVTRALLRCPSLSTILNKSFCLKDFYTVTNGFSIFWSFTSAGCAYRSYLWTLTVSSAI